MGINVQLKGEKGELLADVCDPKMVLSRAALRKFSKTRLLRYVVKWGDAIFNQSQAADLANDIARVRNEFPETPLSATLSKVEKLVERPASESHVYLWFVGD